MIKILGKEGKEGEEGSFFVVNRAPPTLKKFLGWRRPPAILFEKFEKFKKFEKFDNLKI